MSLLGDVGKGIVSGGIWPLADKLGTSDSTVTQVPLETPEQANARKKLLAFADTGTMGNYTAGQGYTGPLGNFDMTDLEKMSQTQLGSMLSQGLPGTVGMGTDALKDILTTEKYNPLNPGGAYDSMTGTIDRQIRDATTAAKRASAYQGNLYSSDAVRSLGDVQAKGQEAKGSLLGSMYQNYIQQKLSAIPQAFNAAQTEDSMNLNRINAGYQAGALPRNLETAKDQAQYQEWLRSRGETGQQLDALKSVASTNTPYGVPSVTVPGQSGWERLLDIGAKIAPYALMAAA